MAAQSAESYLRVADLAISEKKYVVILTAPALRFGTGGPGWPVYSHTERDVRLVIASKNMVGMQPHRSDRRAETETELLWYYVASANPWLPMA